jgi:hypothetical protein
MDFPNINLLNAELNPICHLLALLGGATIVVVSRLRVRYGRPHCSVVRSLSAAVGVFAVPSQRVFYVVEKRKIVSIVEGKKKRFF